jgi:carotenoid cleavage dioxygenase-like enzyme
LKGGFENPQGSKSQIHLVPLDGGISVPLKIEHDPFYFGHFLNTFSTGPGKITFDLDRQSEVFFDRFAFEIQQDKTKRDTWAETHGNAYSTPTRYEVDVDAGTVSSRPLFADPKTQCASNSKWCEFDLFKLHPDDIGRPYCGFWSQHVFFNSTSFASQAVIRADLCGKDGPKVVASWYRPNTYPGEVQFVPKPGSTDKTEGVAIFKVYEGDTKSSKIVVADSKTMATLATAELPVRVPFTVHGNFYPTGSTGCIASQKNVATQIVV